MKVFVVYDSSWFSIDRAFLYEDDAALYTQHKNEETGDKYYFQEVDVHESTNQEASP